MEPWGASQVGLSAAGHLNIGICIVTSELPYHVIDVSEHWYGRVEKNIA